MPSVLSYTKAAIDALLASKASFSDGDARWERGVSVKKYGAIGNGVADDSAAFVAALADNVGKSIYLPKGTYRIDSATRLVLLGNFTSIRGEGAVLSQIKFTHANGGLDIGNGTDLIYENWFRDFAIIGTSSSTTTLVRGRKMFEPFWQGVRIEQALGTLVLLDDCGQLTADRVTLANAAIGYKLTGSTWQPVIDQRLANWYGLGVGCEVSTNLAKFSMRDSWTEATPDLFTFNLPDGTISVGELALDNVRILKTDAPPFASSGQRILRAVDFDHFNANRLDITNCYVEALSSSWPLVDFTAVAVDTTTYFRMHDCVVLYFNTNAMVQVHPAQAWYLFKTDIDKIKYVPIERWAVGTWPEPQRHSSVGGPNTVVAAPPGSLYQQGDTGQLWVKLTGTGNTGWQAVAYQGGSAAIEAPVEVYSADAINNDFASLFMVRRSPAESHDASQPAMYVNGAGQVRAGWADSDSFGSFLAENATHVTAWGAGTAEALTGDDIVLYPKTNDDNIVIGRGSLRLSAFTTAARPTAANAGVGAVILDTTVGKPVFSDGTNWKTFDGTTV